MKGYTNYFEKDGQYYSQNMTWWEKGGYYVPQTPKKITKEQYDTIMAQKETLPLN